MESEWKVRRIPTLLGMPVMEVAPTRMLLVVILLVRSTPEGKVEGGIWKERN